MKSDWRNCVRSKPDFNQLAVEKTVSWRDRELLAFPHDAHKGLIVASELARLLEAMFEAGVSDVISDAR